MVATVVCRHRIPGIVRGIDVTGDTDVISIAVIVAVLIEGIRPGSSSEDDIVVIEGLPY